MFHTTRIHFHVRGGGWWVMVMSWNCVVCDVCKRSAATPWTKWWRCWRGGNSVPEHLAAIKTPSLPPQSSIFFLHKWQTLGLRMRPTPIKWGSMVGNWCCGEKTPPELLNCHPLPQSCLTLSPLKGRIKYSVWRSWIQLSRSCPLLVLPSSPQLDMTTKADHQSTRREKGKE